MNGKTPAAKGAAENPLNRPIKLGGRAVRYPAKSAMNLYVRAVSAHSIVKAVIGILILLAAAVAVAKFGILDRLDNVAAARAELESYQAQESALEEQLADFASIKENYQRYTKNYQTPEEAALIDRLTLVEALDKDAAGLVKVSSVAIAGDSMSVTVIADRLMQVAQFKQVLQTNENFTAADVYNASTVDDQSNNIQYVTATIVLTLAQEVAE